MDRKTRLAVLIALALMMVFAFTAVANLTGSVVWLTFWLTGIVTDVAKGPTWAQWLLYAPAVVLYTCGLIVGFLWVRAAPRKS